MTEAVDPYSPFVISSSEYIFDLAKLAVSLVEPIDVYYGLSKVPNSVQTAYLRKDGRMSEERIFEASSLPEREKFECRYFPLVSPDLAVEARKQLLEAFSAD